MSVYDNALFLWNDATGNLMSILAIQVDHFIFCGNDLLQKNVIAELKKIFKVGMYEIGTLKFLGLVLRNDFFILGLVLRNDFFIFFLGLVLRNDFFILIIFLLIIFYHSVWLGFEIFRLRVQVHCHWVQFYVRAQRI